MRNFILNTHNSFTTISVRKTSRNNLFEFRIHNTSCIQRKHVSSIRSFFFIIIIDVLDALCEIDDGFPNFPEIVPLFLLRKGNATSNGKRFPRSFEYRCAIGSTGSFTKDSLGQTFVENLEYTLLSLWSGCLRF